MNTLDGAIKEMLRVHKKFDIEGSFGNNSQIKSKWPQGLPRSVETDYLFCSYEPVNIQFETGLTPICFLSLSTLNDGQSGYRWVGRSDKALRNENWSAQYLVFMDDIGGGKPIIADTGSPGTPILASYDAMEPFRIANSIADFLLAFAKTIEIVHGKFDVFDIYNEDDHISSRFVKMLYKDVRPLLGDEHFERFIDYFYG